jgi:hypothetical protein
VAVGSAQSAQAMTSQQRARAEGMFCLLCDFVLASFFSSCLKNIVRLSSGLETALNESVKNCKALAQAAEQKEADRAAMSEAISAFCRTFGLSDVPSGSSPQSHLRALAVLASHYDVDLERVSEGYCLLDEEEAALSEVQRLDTAAEGPGAALASFFEVEVLSPASPSEAGPDFAAGRNDAEGAAPPPADT